MQQRGEAPKVHHRLRSASEKAQPGCERMGDQRRTRVRGSSHCLPTTAAQTTAAQGCRLRRRGADPRGRSLSADSAPPVAAADRAACITAPYRCTHSFEGDERRGEKDPAGGILAPHLMARRHRAALLERPEEAPDLVAARAQARIALVGAFGQLAPGAPVRRSRRRRRGSAGCRVRGVRRIRGVQAAGVRGRSRCARR